MATAGCPVAVVPATLPASWLPAPQLVFPRLQPLQRLGTSFASSPPLIRRRAARLIVSHTEHRPYAPFPVKLANQAARKLPLSLLSTAIAQASHSFPYLSHKPDKHTATAHL